MSRKDQWLVTAEIEGIGPLGVFDKFTGGEVDSDEQKYRPGGMQNPVSLGGAVTMGNVTIERLYVLDRDHPIAHQILAGVGVRGITVTKQPLDLNKVPYGRPFVYAGKVKKAQPPEHDSESSDPGMFQIEFVPSGTVG